MAKQMSKNNIILPFFRTSTGIELIRELSIFTQLPKILKPVNRPISQPHTSPMNQINNIDIYISDSLNRTQTTSATSPCPIP